MGDESNYYASQHGKWGMPGVPHKDWWCSKVEDLGEPSATCEMCEVQIIRFVHYMHHACGMHLRTGCVCAGNMEQNASAALAREKVVRLRSGRRERWLSRKWKTSKKGNLYLQTDGIAAVIYDMCGHFKAACRGEDKTDFEHLLPVFHSEAEAKLAVFDHLF